MIVRIILGVLLGGLIIAYYPLILRRGWPYILALVIGAIALYSLRAVPLLSEPLAYGLLVVLLLYAVFLLLRHRGHLKELVHKAKEAKLPIIKIGGHPQLSMVLTLIAYTLGLTFVSYVVILLIYVH